MSVAAIIPAYNEEKTIGSVIQTLQDSILIDRIIVVSDGSEDGTVEEASRFSGIEVIELPINTGKGGALKAGLDYCKDDVIIILDADLIGLTPAHVESLLLPVINNKAMMTVGIFEKGRMATDIAQKMAPFLSGQRALRREILENISDLDLSRFGFEMALHQHVENNDMIVEKVPLPDLSHVMKEEKLGMVKGLSARAKMYWEILIFLTYSALTRKH